MKMTINLSDLDVDRMIEKPETTKQVMAAAVRLVPTGKTIRFDMPEPAAQAVEQKANYIGGR